MITRKLQPAHAPSISIRLCGLWFSLAQAATSFPEPAGADTADFVPIFDGKTLADWDAAPKYWRVENGVLVGEVTLETLTARS